MAQNKQSGRRGRATGSTPFGKRTSAEKSFRSKPTRNRTDQEFDAQGKKSPRALGFTKRPKGAAPSSTTPPPARKKYSKDADSFQGGTPKRSRPFGGSAGASRDDKPGSFARRSGKQARSSDEGSFSKPFARRPPSEGRPYNPDAETRRSKTAPEGGSKFSRPGSFQRKERSSFVKSKTTIGKRGSFAKSKAETPPKKDDGLIRLNKYLANSGLGSRRHADELIKMGLVSVNGQTITEMGFKVKPGDEVRYENKLLKAEKMVYILLNKPKGTITTTQDPQERNTVMHLVAKACKERVYPVGRLDRNTTGLLLLTNDGELAEKLSHPSYNTKKIYKAELDKPLTKADFDKISAGIHLEEGKAVVDDLAIVSDDKKTVGIELHIGWNRIVRRIFEALGYEVIRLDRVVYAGLDKKDLPRGHWRFLKAEEIVKLKHFS